MNSFEIDLKRAVFSWKFLFGLILQIIIIKAAGFKSDIYMISIPVVCTFPYTTAWLLDYQSGYLKLYLQRAGETSYIIGKILSCGISGGLLELMGYLSLYFIKKEDMGQGIWMLIFMSGMLWAVLSATLAAMSGSRYIAYGGSFVIYYLLVIFNQRNTKGLYCLNPFEWVKFEHTWIFGKQGVVLLMASVTIILIFIYYEILRRCIERV